MEKSGEAFEADTGVLVANIITLCAWHHLWSRLEKLLKQVLVDKWQTGSPCVSDIISEKKIIHLKFIQNCAGQSQLCNCNWMGHVVHNSMHLAYIYDFLFCVLMNINSDPKHPQLWLDLKCIVPCYVLLSW